MCRARAKLDLSPLYASDLEQCAADFSLRLYFGPLETAADRRACGLARRAPADGAADRRDERYREGERADAVPPPLAPMLAWGGSGVARAGLAELSRAHAVSEPDVDVLAALRETLGETDGETGGETDGAAAGGGGGGSALAARLALQLAGGADFDAALVLAERYREREIARALARSRSDALARPSPLHCPASERGGARA